MSETTVEALWVGPYQAALPDGRRLIPGVDTATVGTDEARASDYWQTQAAPTPALTSTVDTAPTGLKE